jgi:hypothetical protein
MSAAPRNPYFRLVVVVGGLFAFTALCMFATTLGAPHAPPNRFFDRYGTLLIGIETVALVAVSVLAMMVDSRQSASRKPTHTPAPPSPSDVPASPPSEA